MIRRARLLSVVAILLAGAIGIISSTQTWLTVRLVDGASEDLAVAGASAVPVLAPLSLAVLALGLALSIVGTVLRHIFAVLSVAAGVALGALTLGILTGPPVSAVSAAVGDATGITGDVAVSRLVAAAAPTAWPVVALVAFALLTVAGLFALVTARRWRRGGRKYETRAEGAAAATGPLDAIDSWDDLSRGADPTAGGASR